MKPYKPLIVIILVVFFSSLAIQRGQGQAAAWMHDFMGLFLVVFAMFKLLDVPGFAEGFSMYDILAGRFRFYGFAYPFIELFLGLAYLARISSAALYALTVVLMLFGGIGVIKSLVKGLDVHCACLGTVLKVPLSTVAVFEDLGMALMAFIMLGRFIK